MRYLIFIFPLLFILCVTFAFLRIPYQEFETDKKPLPPGVRASGFDWETHEIIVEPDTTAKYPDRPRILRDTLKYDLIDAIEQLELH